MSSDCENKGQEKYLLQKDASKVECSYWKVVNGAFWTAMVKANYCKYVFWPVRFYLSTKTFPTIVVGFIF